MELEQDGRQQLVALFTFVARDALTGKAHAVNPVVPATPADRALFDQRQAVNDERRAARAAAQGQGPLHHLRSTEAERWAAELLAEAAIKRRLPALADAKSLLMEQTALSNCFTCQPQQVQPGRGLGRDGAACLVCPSAHSYLPALAAASKAFSRHLPCLQRNLHGRIFGGFLMRRAFELAHSTCYLHAGVRPHTLSIDEITFKRPVEVRWGQAQAHSWRSVSHSVAVPLSR